MKGIPYNVIVVATNGGGKGPNVNQVTYAEEDCKWILSAYNFSNLS